MKETNIKESINLFMKELSKAKKEIEEEFRLVSGCKTHGIIHLDLHNICEDSKCTTCREYENAFKEEVKSWRIKHQKINLNKL